MTRRSLPVSLTALVALLLPALAASAAASDTSTPNGRLGDLRSVGSVELRSSCGAAAQAGVERGTALLPAREMLADYLLERGGVREARAEYEACLKLNPGRLNSLCGAGSAAERAGDRDAARRHYEALAAMVAKDATRPEIARARAFLAEASRAPATRSARSPGAH